MKSEKKSYFLLDEARIYRVATYIGGGAEAPPYTAICSFVGMAFLPSACCLLAILMDC